MMRRKTICTNHPPPTSTIHPVPRTWHCLLAYRAIPPAATVVWKKKKIPCGRRRTTMRMPVTFVLTNPWIVSLPPVVISCAALSVAVKCSPVPFAKPRVPPCAFTRVDEDPDKKDDHDSDQDDSDTRQFGFLSSRATKENAQTNTTYTIFEFERTIDLSLWTF